MQIIKNLQNQTEQADSTRRQVPVEKKMRLVQSIRAENMDNRMKIRQRENFLYGTSISSMPSLWNKGEAMQMGEAYPNGENPEEITPVTNTFKIRMTAAIILFIGFLLCDVSGHKIWGYSMNDIYGLITEDYFQIYSNKDAEELPQLTELLRLDD